ncbi:MAG TPA: tetratricopeptide repeat protein [Beijerinckiaceae bacterium]|nr:tetratricopeptide repeat protein [Rhodoblastus sp.]MCC2106164.1 tetratricopeptide repeat protein [Hyphomicrobiales bacterium]HPG02455.1 tetratricopeptide repeat protein [Rhodoblastus sp.]HRY01782.1 tetratricopeptide repeat protein [Beijerinckiaceae bacterium]
MVAQIHAKNQTNPSACATFGLILFHQDKIAEAKEVYSKGFAGVIAALGDRELRFIWGSLSNRDPLRCMHGYALCCEELGDKVGALMMFQRILALNPNDNQGVRFQIPHLMRDLGAEKEAHAFAKKHGFELADPEDDD